MSAAIFASASSKSRHALLPVMALLLFAFALMCGGISSSVTVSNLHSGQETQNKNHSLGAEEGETPRPAADQEFALKKRRSPPGAVSPMDSALDASPRKTFPMADPDSRLLETTTRKALQRYALARLLRLDNPVIRLHPGHAPPRSMVTAG
ncbi:MAG: hypothetical protein ABI858_03805 [Pseudoxanthomonas sp.]